MKIITNSISFTLLDLQHTHEDLYFQDVNAFARRFQNSVIIIDLTNAMKTGKTCTRWNLSADPWKMEDARLVMMNYLEMAFPWCSTFAQLIHSLRAGTQPEEVDGLNTYTSEQAATRTFSPFAPVKPVKLGDRLNASTIAKAIRAGQITAARTDGRYTDDYAMDAAYDFYRGEIDLSEFAADIYEQPSGWRFWWKNPEKTEIVAACHTFDYKTLTVA